MRRNGGGLPEEWVGGVIVHLYKNEGVGDCASYRPICVAEIIYEIWPQLIARGISKILHTRTSPHQYGYKAHLSTSDAIAKRESYLVKAANRANSPDGPNNIIWGISQNNALGDTLQKGSTDRHDRASEGDIKHQSTS